MGFSSSPGGTLEFCYFLLGPFWLGYGPLGRRGGGPSSQGLLVFLVLLYWFGGLFQFAPTLCTWNGPGLHTHLPIVYVRAGSCYAAPWASHLGCASNPAVGTGAGSRGGGGWWEPWRGRLVGWCGVPWGWVLGAAVSLIELPTWGCAKTPRALLLHDKSGPES